MKNSLVRTGWICTVIPLLCQMGLFFFQFQLSKSSERLEQASNLELEASDILARMSELANINVALLLNKGIQGRTVRGTSFVSNLQELASCRKTFEALAINEREKSEVLTELDSLNNYMVLSATTPNDQQLQNPDHIESVGAFASRVTRLRSVARDGLLKMHALVEVTRAHRAELKKQRLEQQEKLQQIQTFLLWALLLDLIVGVSVPLIFLLNTKGRLEKLIANARKLPSGKDFAPVAGNDEVAFLNSVLQDTSNRLTESENERQTLFDMITHDIRSPLTSAGLLIEETNGSDDPSLNFYQTQFGKLNRIFGTLKRLVEDLLSLENLRSGAIQLNLELVHARNLIESTVSGLQPQLKDKNITLKQNVSDSELIADPTRLEQVLENLLSNAIKHSPNGSEILVTSASDLMGTTFSITDQGPGVESGAEKLIFDRKYQTKQGQKKGGYGIGLTICKELVEKHGGKIWLNNQSSGGCTFSFFIPGETELFN